MQMPRGEGQRRSSHSIRLALAAQAPAAASRAKLTQPERAESQNAATSSRPTAVFRVIVEGSFGQIAEIALGAPSPVFAFAVAKQLAYPDSCASCFAARRCGMKTSPAPSPAR
jgi:hypothetical protein